MRRLTAGERERDAHQRLTLWRFFRA